MTAGASDLAQGLLEAVRAQDLGSTPDAWQAGATVAAFPSIDLALADFAHAGGPRCANVLFSRGHPQGWVAAIGGDAGAVQGLRIDADLQDAQRNSAAWQPGAGWSHLHWRAIEEARTGALQRFVAPYPASLLKLMVAVGVGLAVQRGLCRWPAALEPMIAASDNEATEDCLALLHRVGLLSPSRGNALNATFAAWGLGTLQVNDTTPRGGWRNADGAGVGPIHINIRRPGTRYACFGCWIRRPRPRPGCQQARRLCSRPSGYGSTPCWRASSTTGFSPAAACAACPSGCTKGPTRRSSRTRPSTPTTAPPTPASSKAAAGTAWWPC